MIPPNFNLTIKPGNDWRELRTSPSRRTQGSVELMLVAGNGNHLFDLSSGDVVKLVEGLMVAKVAAAHGWTGERRSGNERRAG